MWKPHSCLSVMGVVREETSHSCAMVSIGLWGLSVRKPHTDVQWFQLDSAGNNCGGRSDTLSRRQPSKYVCVRLPLQDSVSTSTHFLALLFSLLIHAILLSLSSWWVLVWHRFYHARNSRYWPMAFPLLPRRAASWTLSVQQAVLAPLFQIRVFHYLQNVTATSHRALSVNNLCVRLYLDFQIMYVLNRTARCPVVPHSGAL